MSLFTVNILFVRNNLQQFVTPSENFEANGIKCYIRLFLYSLFTIIPARRIKKKPFRIKFYYFSNFVIKVRETSTRWMILTFLITIILVRIRYLRFILSNFLFLLNNQLGFAIFLLLGKVVLSNGKNA